MSPQILVRSIIFTIPPPNLIVILKDKFVKENLATSDDEELTDSEETKDSLSELVEDRRREERAILHLSRISGGNSARKMDEVTFNEKRKTMVKLVRKAMTAVSDYTETDVELYDVESDNVSKRLDQVRNKMLTATDHADDLLGEIEESEDAAGVKEFRIRDIEKLKGDAQEKVKENERKVKARAMIVKKAGDVAAAAPGEGTRAQDVAAELEGKQAKVRVIQKQVAEKSRSLKKVVTDMTETKDMKELELRETLLESKEWLKKQEEVQKMDSLEQEAATLKVDVVEQATLFEEMRITVENKITEMKRIDKEKGYHSLTHTKPKEGVVYPKPFAGEFGENVFRWIKDMKEAIDSAQIKEDDKVKKMRQYLAGEAKVKVGEYHTNLDSALKALEDYYGNPRAIWARCRKQLEDAVGNFRTDWGVYGSQKRITAIARTQDFIREAETLATDFPEILENEVYSGNTNSLLRKVLPREYTEKINDVISDINSSDKEKIGTIKKYLEGKKRSAILGLDIDTEQAGKSSGGGVNVNSWDGNERKEAHDCGKARACRKEWHLLGCKLVYELDNSRQRRDKMVAMRACMKCGAPFRKERDGSLHKCKWDGDKAIVRCQVSGCVFGAAVCGDHEEVSNCSDELLSWTSKEQIVTNVFTSFTGSSENRVESETRVCCEKVGSRETELLEDRKLKEALAMKGKRQGVDKRKIRDLPEGQGTFEFCVIRGKNRPLMGFVDSGADSWVVRDDAVGELVAVKIVDGPIPLTVASNKVIQATGEWGALLPLADGTHQVVRGISLPEVTGKSAATQFEAVA